MILDYKGVLAAGAVLLAFGYIITRKAENTASEVAHAINPVNPENVFYGGVNEVGAAITGKEDFNLGVWIYDQLNTGMGE